MEIYVSNCVIILDWKSALTPKDLKGIDAKTCKFLLRIWWTWGQGKWWFSQEYDDVTSSDGNTPMWLPSYKISDWLDGLWITSFWMSCSISWISEVMKHWWNFITVQGVLKYTIQPLFETIPFLTAEKLGSKGKGSQRNGFTYEMYLLFLSKRYQTIR